MLCRIWGFRILAGTLGVRGCVDTIDSLGKLCSRAGKKFYTFVMGKLNVAKLANFMEIDVRALCRARSGHPP